MRYMVMANIDFSQARSSKLRKMPTLGAGAYQSFLARGAGIARVPPPSHPFTDSGIMTEPTLLQLRDSGGVAPHFL